MFNLKISYNRFFLFVLVLLTILGCDNMKISKYKGDGKIISTGWDFISSGYQIEFENFDLKSPYSKTYKIIEFPKTNKTFWCGLYIKSHDDVTELFNGFLKLTLSTPKKGDIFICNASLKDWEHSVVKPNDYHEYFFYFFNGKNTSSFKLNDINDELFLLSVSYEPKSIKSDYNGAIQIRVGGFK